MDGKRQPKEVYGEKQEKKKKKKKKKNKVEEFQLAKFASQASQAKTDRMVAHNCHSNSKLLTAQTKIFTAITNNSHHKPKYSQQ